MLHPKVLLTILFFMCTFVINAQDVINYFKVSSNIAKPVTIHTNKGKYKIWGGERIDGNLYSVRAYDANGNQIVENTPYKWESSTNKPTIRYYYFKSTYSSSTNKNTNSNSYNTYGTYNSSSQSSSGYRTNSFTNNLEKGAREARYFDIEGYPNLQVRLGWSAHFGEIVTLKGQLGSYSGWVLAGGVGKNFFDMYLPCKISWFVEAGYYIGFDGHDITFNSIGGRNQSHPKDPMIGVLIEYSYFFENSVPRLGLFASGQYGLYFGMEVNETSDIITKAAWDFRIGIAWKVLSD